MRKSLVFLGVLDDVDVEWMIGSGTRRTVAPGHVLIEEGQPIESLYIVVNGLLSVVSRAAGGLELAQLRAGEVVGEISFVDSRPPSATVRALDSTRILEIPRHKLNDKLEDDQGFAARFYRALAMFLADRLRSTVPRLGYGGANAQQDDPDELSPEILEMVSLAGTRFQRLESRLFEM